jgi:hypothetical protein
MTINYYGNIVDIKFDKTDSSGTAITLIDGYSIEEMTILNNNGIYGLFVGAPISATTEKLCFPPVNSKNPNVIKPLFNTPENKRFTFIITKFGQIPDPHYFDKAFEPILVTGADGNEYNVIPSDQFK